MEPCPAATGGSGFTIEIGSDFGFSRALDDPWPPTAQPSRFSGGFLVDRDRRRAAIIKCAGEPDFVIGPIPAGKSERLLNSCLPRRFRRRQFPLTTRLLTRINHGDSIVDVRCRYVAKGQHKRIYGVDVQEPARIAR
jgi:hypothetical protein